MYKIIKFTLLMLFIERKKNIAVSLIFGLIIFILLSFIILTDGVKAEYRKIIDNYPDMTVFREKGGRIIEIPEKWTDDIILFSGVESVGKLVTGLYKFEKVNKYFTIIGVDFYSSINRKYIADLVNRDIDFNSFFKKDSMIVGSGVDRLMEDNFYHKTFNFFTAGGEKIEVMKYRVFNKGLELETNDIVLVPIGLARRILGIEADIITDISVNVTQPLEIPVIARKIREKYPELFILSKEQLKGEKMKLYNYKSGLFLLLFLSSFFAFGILLFTRVSALNDDQKKRIAILRTLGWSIKNILSWKVLEAFIISLFTFTLAFFTSVLYVFKFKAPFLSSIILGRANLSPDFTIPLYVDIKLVFSICVFTLLFYILVSLIPAWKAAIIDPGGVLR